MKKFFKQLYIYYKYQFRVWKWYLHTYYLEVTIAHRYPRLVLLKKRLKLYFVGLVLFYFWVVYTEYIFVQSEISVGHGYDFMEVDSEFRANYANDFWELVLALFLAWHIYFLISLYFIDLYFYIKKIRYGIFLFCCFMVLFGLTWYWEVMTVYLFQVSYLFWFYYTIMAIAGVLINFEVDEEDEADELLALEEKAHKRELLKRKEAGYKDDPNGPTWRQTKKLTLADAARVFFAMISVEDHIETPEETFKRYVEHVGIINKQPYAELLNGYFYNSGWKIRKWWIHEELDEKNDELFIRFLYKYKYNVNSTNLFRRIRNDLIVIRYNYYLRRVQIRSIFKKYLKQWLGYIFNPIYKIWILFSNPDLFERPFSCVMGPYVWYDPYTKKYQPKTNKTKKYIWSFKLERYMFKYIYYSRIKFRLYNKKKNFWFINK